MLVQLQPDRLLLNWRRGTGHSEYPHFETVTEEFQRVYADLEAFANEQNLGAIDPDQCEMTYVNLLARYGARDQAPPLGDKLRLWSGMG